MDNCFVYVLADVTGIRYIGVSIHPEQRFKNHIYEATNKGGKSYNLRKSKWLRSIDFNFYHRIIFSGTEEACYKKEVELIKLALDKNKKLVNLTRGGDRPPKIIDLENYEEVREKIRSKATGRKLSAETKKKMSDSHKKNGAPTWIGDASGYKNPRARPVAQIDDNNNIIFVWSCGKEAVDALKLNKTDIVNVCSGRQKTAKGYRFKYF